MPQARLIPSERDLKRARRALARAYDGEEARQGTVFHLAEMIVEGKLDTDGVEPEEYLRQALATGQVRKLTAQVQSAPRQARNPS